MFRHAWHACIMTTPFLCCSVVRKPKTLESLIAYGFLLHLLPSICLVFWKYIGFFFSLLLANSDSLTNKFCCSPNESSTTPNRIKLKVSELWNMKYALYLRNSMRQLWCLLFLVTKADAGSLKSLGSSEGTTCGNSPTEAKEVDDGCTSNCKGNWISLWNVPGLGFGERRVGD